MFFHIPKFVYHLITLRIIEADAAMKTVTIISSSVTITRFLSNEKSWQFRKTDGKDYPLRRGGRGGVVFWHGFFVLVNPSYIRYLFPCLQGHIVIIKFLKKCLC